ncbi:MAG: hemerythrin family protein [Thermodesulfovibrionales bacterium]|nr:hemerythrin family protein [Thermodesulfovibrionales bacterium]
MEWTPDLTVDNGKIDEQHRELFKRITKLVEAIKSKTCKYEIGPTTAFLEEYIVEHFHDEEEMMRKAGFPDFDAHKAIHENFISDFNELKKDLEGEDSNYTKSVYTNQIVVDWILAHIQEMDKSFGRYLKSPE